MYIIGSPILTYLSFRFIKKSFLPREVHIRTDKLIVSIKLKTADKDIIIGNKKKDLKIYRYYI
jgi:hypothetical protein